MNEVRQYISRRRMFSFIGTVMGLMATGTMLKVTEAGAQTAGMDRRQGRREGRQNRRDDRRQVRDVRRDARRGTVPANTATTGSSTATPK